MRRFSLAFALPRGGPIISRTLEGQVDGRSLFRAFYAADAGLAVALMPARRYLCAPRCFRVGAYDFAGYSGAVIARFGY